MTKTSNREHHLNSATRKRFWFLVLTRGGIAFGGIFLVGLTVVSWRLWTFVQKELTPLAEKSLTTTLNRPVNLGKVTGFSLTGVKFEASAIPATPTDPDRVAVDAVEVGFNPLELIFNRQLKLDVTLVNPDVYIEQDKQDRWITVSIAPPGEEGPIKTDLDKLHFRNGKLTLLGQKRVLEVGEQRSRGAGGAKSPSSFSSPVAFSQLSGTAQILENNQKIRFDVEGQADSGGSVSVQGETLAKVIAGTFQVRGQGLLAADVTRLVKLPLELQAGRVNGDLQIQQGVEQKPLLFGSADLQGVTIQVPRLQQTLNKTQGNLRFQGTEIQLDGLTTNYGKIPVIATGIIDTEAGFKLAGRVKAVSVADAKQTLNLQLPVPVSGQLKADVKLVGSAISPILSGTVATTKPARIDKVDFNSVSGDFEFATSNSLVTLRDIQGVAKVGGQIIGGGTIKMGETPRLNLNFAAKNVPGNAIAKLYDTTPGFQIGTVSATAQVTGNADDVKTVVQWQAPRATYPGTGEVVVNSNRTVSFRNVALNFGGGVVRASGSYANERWQAVAQASGIELEPFVDKSQLQNISLAGANFNGRLILSGTTTPFQVASIRTENAGVQIAGGTVAVSQVKLQDQSFSAQLVANDVRLGRIFKQSPPAFGGPLAGTFQIAGNRENFSLKTLRGTGEGRLQVAGGIVTAKNIQLADGVYQAQVLANNLAVRELATTPPQFRGRLTGQFQVAGSVESFQPQAIQASGQARVNVAGGTITASNIQLTNGRYQAQVQANNVPLQQLAAVPPQFQGGLNGQLNVAGSVESFQPQSIQASGQARVNLAGGAITASNIQLANGRYQAVVNAAGVELNRLNQQLKGQFGGKLQVAGTLGTAVLDDLRAAGQVQLSQGLAGIERPLTAAVAWNGEKLTIDRATAPGLSVSGDILANTRRAGIPEITQLNLNVQAQNYNLQQLPINLPNQVAVAGKVDFNGRVTGKLPLPNVTGQINLRDLIVQGLAFEPLLRGNIVSAQGQGLNLDLAGTSDRLAFNLDGNNRPKSFLVKWKEAVAIGNAQGNDLALNLANFPLQVLNLTPPPTLRLGGGQVAGTLSGDLQVNQQTLTTSGKLAIAGPKIGRIQGDRLAAEFRYGNNQATVTSSEFVKGNSRYAFAGSFGQTSQGPQLQGKLNVQQGNIQDILTVAQIYELQDFQRGSAEPSYGRAADLTTYPVGLQDQPLLTQIKRFYEIEALLAAQEQQRDSTAIPDLADLEGTFSGEVAVDTATADGLAVQFDLNGQNFVWGRENEASRYYRANKIIAEGSFEKGVLKFRPFRIESENSLLAFSGNVGGNEQSGQLRVNNFPIQLLNNFVDLPVDITGNLNGSAALAGSIANPQARGELEITAGTLNQKAIESATASFSYTNGRLNFGSNVSVAGPEPVNISGSIPYQLPFASVAPDNNQISLDVKVRNEGLALINLLTQQVEFEKGEGEVDLKVRGTRQRPELEGIATVNDATFSAPALPGKVRRVTGKVNFNFDRILVENLQGRFSRGQVEAAGAIPIFNNSAANIENPLTVKADELTLNLKGLYQGGASGNLLITGSALNPLVGGKVNLFNGKVLLAESTESNQPANSNNVNVSLTKANKQSKTDTGDAIAKFNNLEIELGKNVEVIRPPILSFQAAGNLIVNGSFADPIPDGTIKLKQGGVNLFTTQFKLVRGYENTATFKANQPRDPILDVKLFAKVLDVIQNSDFSRTNTAGLGALESVRVEATVTGAASKLDENLELTSSPSRSETEIVALLGGGFVDTEGRGDSTLGLINIAGSAVFNNFQSAFNQIGNAFGLSEFRIFPTIISDNPEAGRSSSTLELAAEAGIDISTKFSISSIKILTASDPFQWGINYRINDEFRVRASTNLDDDSRAVVEFQRRF
ncbi:translocation/assembly module TamB domain-containing protein [Dendronalium sp. ChiSLP03b]|uniref:translocation/assembly module TamB domain-containing protein n=1 Tax=Dendronalium sp. ChiSLP03b TaxID=3075381 RepID=UPI002AD584B4|nr:translocation/assembly module TamB domain-containing protein [Dendronalium sp. ChiSLP03b]MDZ8203143.1 translocation/assembly module TamB domain-containing protein [Dendronalium sp. ChiSLP03b]